MRTVLAPARQRLRWRLVLACAVGVAVAAATLGLIASGLVSGLLAVGVFALLLASVPTSAEFSRRIAYNGAIALGAVPLLWWVRWPPLDSVGHAPAVLALAAGAVAFLAARRHDAWRSV